MQKPFDFAHLKYMCVVDWLKIHVVSNVFYIKEDSLDTMIYSPIDERCLTTRTSRGFCIVLLTK